MTQIIITLDDKVTPIYAFDFFKRINFIRDIVFKKVKKQNIDDVTLFAEKSLADEWLSDEDNRWDKLL
ncbi:MAG: hypothetical protein V1781_04175 [Bacteroidota bacterium]